MPYTVYILGITIFSLGTSEFMIAGMIPSLTSALNISITQAGHLISFYAAGMVAGGPLLTVCLLRMHTPNKPALLWLLGFYAAAQSVAALSDSYLLMSLARVMTGMIGGACFGVALAICAEVVEAGQRGRAASIVLGGLMLATVMGVPIATLIDQNIGWRFSFWLIVVLAIVCASVIAIGVPRTRRTSAPVSLNQELTEFKNPHLWAAYSSSALIIGATFAAFSYFTPILLEVSGLPATAIPWLLMGYGITNMAGNAIVGRYADRHTFLVMVCGLSLLITALVIFALLAENAAVSIAMMLVIGLTGITLNPAMTARVMQTARPGALVNTMHASIINIGLGSGTWLGGMGIALGYGLHTPLWIGAGLAVAGLVSLAPYIMKNRFTTPTIINHSPPVFSTRFSPGRAYEHRKPCR